MNDDEFDGPDVGPVPPHERQWRHPAEIAHETRTSFMRDASPPPLSRRTTAVVATASLAASAVLLALTLPRGIDDDVATTETAVVSLVKGSAPDTHVVEIAGRNVGAIPAGNGHYITSMTAIGTLSFVSLRSLRTGEIFDAQVVSADPRLGVAILRVDPVSSLVAHGNLLASLPGVMVPESGMRVVHPHDGSEVNCHPSITLNAAVDDDTAPVTVDGSVKGAAVVTDSWGTPLGIVVDKSGGHWMISGSALQTAVEEASGLFLAAES